jgi:hypothetical protein
LKPHSTPGGTTLKKKTKQKKTKQQTNKKPQQQKLNLHYVREFSCTYQLFWPLWCSRRFWNDPNLVLHFVITSPLERTCSLIKTNFPSLLLSSFFFPVWNPMGYIFHNTVQFISPKYGRHIAHCSLQLIASYKEYIENLLFLIINKNLK